MSIVLERSNFSLFQTKTKELVLLYKNSYKIRKDVGIIYALVDPRNNDIRYIGKSLNYDLRPKLHWKSGSMKREKNPFKRKWLQDLINLNLEPKIYFVDFVYHFDNKQIANSLLYLKEEQYIKKFKEYGYNLTNLFSNGDSSGHDFSNKTKKKMSDSAKKRGTHNIDIFKFKQKFKNKLINDIEYRFCDNCDSWLDLKKFSKLNKRLSRKCSKCRYLLYGKNKCPKLKFKTLS